MRRANPREDRGDLLLHLLVEDHLAAGEPRHDLGGEVVRGRAEPAARDDQVDPLAGEEAQRRLEVLGAVADDDDVGDLDAQLAEPLRDPGPVAVGDPAGQDLGAGDEDPGPHAVAHGQSTRELDLAHAGVDLERRPAPWARIAARRSPVHEQVDLRSPIVPTGSEAGSCSERLERLSSAAGAEDLAVDQRLLAVAGSRQTCTPSASATRLTVTVGRPRRLLGRRRASSAALRRLPSCLRSCVAVPWPSVALVAAAVRPRTSSIATITT